MKVLNKLILKSTKNELLNSVCLSSYINRPSDIYLENIFLKNNFDKYIKYYKEGHTEFVTIELNDDLYIIFQGTNGKKDWKDNFKFFKQSTKVLPYNNKESKIKVHKGFIEQYKKVREQIHTIIKDKVEHKKCIKKLIICGHSLGGALSRLCAVDIQCNFSHYYSSLYCLVFGCPNIGNKEFERSFEKRIPIFLSFKNHNDVVCNIPLEILGFKESDRVQLKSDKKGDWLKGFALFGNWQDHYPNRYEEAIYSMYIKNGLI